jgi:hypothetical protein
MPRVKGPLFSLAASGTFDNKLEFRTTAAGPVVAKIRKANPNRTPAQEAQAERFALAVAGWRGAGIPVRDAWRNAATPLGLIGYRYFLAEWMAQNITAPDLPVIP